MRSARMSADNHESFFAHEVEKRHPTTTAGACSLNKEIAEMSSKQRLIYLSDADVQACGASALEITEAVRRAFQDLQAGAAVVQPQLEMVADANLDFKAKGGILMSEHIAAVKWYGFSADNPKRGLPNFIPLIILNALPTGSPLAVMDGHWISGVRTAALSTVAARALAHPQSESVGFIGAGLQAISHLDALLDCFPLRRITVHSRTHASASRLLEHAGKLGLQAAWTEDAQTAVRDHAIVVSSIPRLTERASFLDASWLAAGSFVAMVDAGRAWRTESLAAIDCAYTDHLDARTGRPLETLFYDGPYAGQLSELAGREPDTLPIAPDARRAMVFGGSGLADTAVAGLIYRKAVARGLGMVLPT